METRIKEAPTLEFDYAVFMEMLKECLLPRKVRQIEVGTKLKSLRQRDNQTLSEFISLLEALDPNPNPNSSATLLGLSQRSFYP